MRNFVEAVELEVARCYRQLRHTQHPLPPADAPLPDEWRNALDADAERQRLARLTDKYERYAQVKALLAQGCPATEIAQRLAMPVRTVYRWQKRDRCPAHQSPRSKHPDQQERYEHIRELRERGLAPQEIARLLGIGVRTVYRWQGPDIPRRKRRSMFDPYAAYVLARWQQGEHSVALLWHEIQEQGFHGSLQTMYRFIHTLRYQATPLPPPGITERFSVQQALWLLVRPQERLKDDEQSNLQAVCDGCSELAALHVLAQSFGQIVRKREGHRLQGWIQQIEASNFRDVQRFVAGLQRDHAEVLAGLTLVYSNGMVEGFVNKLKLIKRMGYGRARFPLLRQRVLHAL